VRQHRVHRREHGPHRAADARAAPPNRARSAPIARRERAHHPPERKRPHDNLVSTDSRRQRATWDLRGGVSIVKCRVHRALNRLRNPRVARYRGVHDGEADAVDVTRERGGEGEDDEGEARGGEGGGRHTASRAALCGETPTRTVDETLRS